MQVYITLKDFLPARVMCKLKQSGLSNTCANWSTSMELFAIGHLRRFPLFTRNPGSICGPLHFARMLRKGIPFIYYFHSAVCHLAHL